MLWPFTHRRYTDVMEDKDKVNDILKILNKGDIETIWAPVDGLSSLMRVDIKMEGGKKSADFSLNSGVPVKAFLNTQTGEMKFFTYEAVI